jgi:4-hydroxy-3-polyprenylbenzoate decarboxylase
VRLVVGVSGASGAIYGIRTLEILKELGVETHLVLTTAACETIRLEANRKVADVEKLATRSYEIGDIAASLSSGSFQTDGMVIVPCSAKTLGGIASGYSDNLLLRAAEVTMKERRPLVLMVRETPLTLIDIENMAKVTRAGAVVMPAIPAFYHQPQTIDDLVDQLVGKVLDMLGLKHSLYKRWKGSVTSGRT